MKNELIKQDFDFHISEYLYYCQSRRLRPKTISSYDQSLRLFARWALENAGLSSPIEICEQTIRHYVCDLQARGKYSFYADEIQKTINYPERRKDFASLLVLPLLTTISVISGPSLTGFIVTV